MDYFRLDQQFKQALGDSGGCSYDDGARRAALSSAIRGYSRYVPLTRRIGTGALCELANSGETQIVATGGPFAVGDSLKIDLGSNLETVTVSAVASYSGYELDSGCPALLTVSALTKSHSAGCFLQRSIVGLALVANQDTYALPLDFLGPDQDSLDVAIGIRASICKTGGFYDAAYFSANKYSGPTPNGRQGYSGIGNDYSNNPNSGAFSNSSQEIVYRFVLSGTPYLTITPVPIVSKVLDFWYWAQQTVDTIPDKDLDAVLALAKAEAFTQTASDMGGSLNWSEDDVSESPDKNVRALLEMAEAERAKFDMAIRKRPVLIGG